MRSKIGEWQFLCNSHTLIDESGESKIEESNNHKWPTWLWFRSGCQYGLTDDLLYDYWLSLPDCQSKWKERLQMWGGEEGRFGSPFQFFSQNPSDWKGSLALVLPPSLLVSSLPVDRAAFPSASVNNSSGCLPGWRKFWEMQEIFEMQITIGAYQQTRILVSEEYLDTFKL